MKYILVTLIFFANSALAGTIFVPVDASTIQQAIDNAIDGDTIIVYPGTYQESINLRGKAILFWSQ